MLAEMAVLGQSRWWIGRDEQHLRRKNRKNLAGRRKRLCELPMERTRQQCGAGLPTAYPINEKGRKTNRSNFVSLWMLSNERSALAAKICFDRPSHADNKKQCQPLFTAIVISDSPMIPTDGKAKIPFVPGCGGVSHFSSFAGLYPHCVRFLTSKVKWYSYVSLSQYCTAECSPPFFSMSHLCTNVIVL